MKKPSVIEFSSESESSTPSPPVTPTLYRRLEPSRAPAEHYQPPSPASVLSMHPNPSKPPSPENFTPLSVRPIPKNDDGTTMSMASIRDEIIRLLHRHYKTGVTLNPFVPQISKMTMLSLFKVFTIISECHKIAGPWFF